jgi:hypothetical protein
MSFKFYARIKDSVLQQGYGLDSESLELTKQQYPDETFIEVDFLADPDLYYFEDGSVKKKQEKTSETSFWDETSISWVENQELKKVENKSKRNTLLASCDWTQLADIPSETKLLWEPYRQALRDITNQPDPFNIVWPTRPQ